MPGRPRKHVIRKDEIGIFHVWSRCVRQCWLCGVDPQTGQDYSHRKQWIHQRLEDLARIFAIDACVYAILSNHYHLIVRNRIDLARQWTAEEVRAAGGSFIPSGTTSPANRRNRPSWKSAAWPPIPSRWRSGGTGWGTSPGS